MDNPPSKSQQKREAEALQKIGVKLVALPVNLLEKLPIPANLRQAIDQAKQIKSHGAIRRQAQLIGKLMRQTDHEAIILAYESLLEEENSQTAVFHGLEQWRDRFIQEDKEAVTEFVNQYQPDVQQLRQHIKQAIVEHRTGKPVGAAKALFRFLRSCL